MAGIMKAMATSFKGICACTVVFRAPDPAAGHPCDAIQPSHPLSSPSPPAPNPSQDSSRGPWTLTGKSGSTQEKEMQKGKMVVSGDHTNG